MSTEADSALAFLASLRARRARIDELIEKVVAFLQAEGLLPATPQEVTPQPSNDAPAAAPRAEDTKKGVFTGMSLTDAVKKHLEQSREPQTVTQITEALRQGGMPDVQHTNVYNAVWRRANRIKDVVAVEGNRWAIREGGAPDKPTAERKLGSRNGLTMFNGTEQILREAGKPLHAEVIVEELAKLGKPTNVRSLTGTLPQDIQKRFENLGRNMWALVEWPEEVKKSSTPPTLL